MRTASLAGMRALALSIVLTLAQPGVFAAAQSPETDEPDRVLATELPTRAAVWARFEAAVAREIEASGNEAVWEDIYYRSEASWVLSAYGEHRLAADLALSAAEIFRGQFVNPGDLSEARPVFNALIEAGLDIEAERLAREFVEAGNALIAAAESQEDANRLSWNLLYCLHAFPEIQDAFAERMLSQPSYDAGEQDDLLHLMIDNALETGSRAGALHLASVQIDFQLGAGIEPDWRDVARVMAVTQTGPRRDAAIAWARNSLAGNWELPDWFADVADDLVELSDHEAAAHFHEESLRAALASQNGPDADQVARSALGLSLTGGCDLALPAANLAELLDRVEDVRDRIAYDEDVIVFDHQPGRERPASRILRARIACGQSQSGFSAYFSEPHPDGMQFSTWVIDDIGQALGDEADQRAWYRAYGEFLARDHFSGANRYADHEAPDGLAFQSHVLRQAGYFQLADGVLLAAWNASVNGDEWPDDFVGIYAALPKD